MVTFLLPRFRSRHRRGFWSRDSWDRQKREDPSCTEGSLVFPIVQADLPGIGTLLARAGRLSWHQRAGPSATLDRAIQLLRNLLGRATSRQTRG